ncbi:uncharacterized protein PAE49_024108 [Odontesthes bonariensis]
METPLLAAQPRGIGLSLPTCRDTQCSGHGSCVAPSGGGTNLVCDCDLGYQGDTCEDTVNGALSLPLSISVVAVIVGLLIIAFVFAKLRQRQKKSQRKRLAATHDYNIAV